MERRSKGGGKRQREGRANAHPNNKRKASFRFRITSDLFLFSVPLPPPLPPIPFSFSPFFFFSFLFALFWWFLNSLLFFRHNLYQFLSRPHLRSWSILRFMYHSRRMSLLSDVELCSNARADVTWNGIFIFFFFWFQGKNKWKFFLKIDKMLRNQTATLENGEFKSKKAQ